MKEKIYEYELIPFGHDCVDAMPRRYRIFRFTAQEAHEHNQQYILNDTKKRLVKIEKREIK